MNLIDIFELYGHMFSANGISADPKTICAIRNTRIPTYVGEFRSFFGYDELCGVVSRCLHGQNA